ncbi:MAG: hypothetical protein DME26_13035 [Verrucomicrobia bacterium]|nr:MAG: hypothetical protein DME26_13035 [Verrucomicrobiota bacterium]
MTVGENISLPVRYHRNCAIQEAQDYLSPLIESMELSSWLAITPGRLGLKWSQRTGLARALAVKPDALLLDNPVAGLDPKETSWWVDTLGELASGQHPWMEGKPVTLVMACDDIRPWKMQGKQFAALTNKRWQVLGSRDQLADCTDKALKELLEPEFANR